MKVLLMSLDHINALTLMMAAQSTIIQEDSIVCIVPDEVEMDGAVAPIKFANRHHVHHDILTITQCTPTINWVHPPLNGKYINKFTKVHKTQLQLQHFARDTA